MQPIQLFIKDRSISTLKVCIKIMNPESIEKTALCLAVTETVRTAFIHRINMTQKLTRVRNILLTTTQIIPPLLTQ